MSKAVVVLTITLAVFLGLPAKTYALWPFDLFTQNSATGSQTRFPALIQRMVDKFELDSGEVQKVMEEVQTERQQEARARREAKLEEAVKAGVITNEQKQALLDKEDEWQQKQGQLREEMLRWREESGIDFDKLAPYKIGLGGFGGKGFGRGHRFGGF